MDCLSSAWWVAEAECRIRDQGHVLHIEAFVVPVDGRAPSLEEAAQLRERCVELDWRAQDFVLSVAEKLPEELLPPPQLQDRGPRGPRARLLTTVSKEES